MDIAIACHCFNHVSLAIQIGKSVKLLKSAEYKDRVTYISLKEYCPGEDTQTKSWNEVPDNSIDVIWSRHCPIQYIFHKNRTDDDYQITIFKNILTDGWRILRNNGKVYIPISKKNNHRYTKKVTDELMKTLTTNKWHSEIIDIKDSPFLISDKYLVKPLKWFPSWGRITNDLDTDTYSHVYVLTKSVPSGATRSRKITLRRSGLNRGGIRVKRHTRRATVRSANLTY